MSFTDFDIETDFLDNPSDYLELNPQDYKPKKHASYDGATFSSIKNSELNKLYIDTVIAPRMDKRRQKAELNRTIEINAQNKRRAENRKSTCKIVIGFIVFVIVVCLIVL